MVKWRLVPRSVILRQDPTAVLWAAIVIEKNSAGRLSVPIDWGSVPVRSFIRRLIPDPKQRRSSAANAAKQNMGISEAGRISRIYAEL